MCIMGACVYHRPINPPRRYDQLRSLEESDASDNEILARADALQVTHPYTLAYTHTYTLAGHTSIHTCRSPIHTHLQQHATTHSHTTMHPHTSYLIILWIIPHTHLHRHTHTTLISHSHPDQPHTHTPPPPPSPPPPLTLQTRIRSSLRLGKLAMAIKRRQVKRTDRQIELAKAFAHSVQGQTCGGRMTA